MEFGMSRGIMPMLKNIYIYVRISNKGNWAQIWTVLQKETLTRGILVMILTMDTVKTVFIP